MHPRRLLEPVSALTHLVATLGSLAGLVVLLRLTKDEPAKMASLTVYGGSLVTLYAVSTVFHGVKLPPRQRMWLNRLDHAAIFLLIAGSYTPIVYNLFPANWRWSVLAAVWLLATIGMAYKMISRRIHGLINATVYPALSWAGAVPAWLANRTEPLMPAGGIGLLLLGGLIFMAGFVVYYRRRPDPWPGVLGHHELWHLCVMAGTFTHFLFMLRFVVPA